MGWGMGNLSGDSGGGLNFKVVGNPKPTNPKDNTIWINTDIAITSWVFSTTEPSDMVEGTVWIATGSKSSVEFNALKKNGIKLYPLSAKQVVGNSLVKVDAMIYQDEKWKSWWNGELYKYGDQYEQMTGGFEAKPLALGGAWPLATSPIINAGSKSMTITNPTGGGVAVTKNKIDLTDYKTLEFNGSMVASGTVSDVVHIGIWKELGTYCTDNRVAVLAGNRQSGTYTISVNSLSGEYYIGFYVWTGSSITVNSLQLL